MQLLIYCLVYPILWGISKLPWRLFYMFSTGIYILMYYIVRYRRKTVTENLTLVFPEKSQKEIKSISKKTYKHMSDMFLEMIKSISISSEEMKDRFKITNLDMLKRLEDENKSIIVMMGHYASYEWTNVVDLISKFGCVGIYKPIENKYFDRLAHRIRARFGSRVIANRIAYKEMIKDLNDNRLSLYGLFSDQSPKATTSKYWTNFMGVRVPAFTGGEVLSKRLGLSIFYLNVEKVNRGYYEASLIPISEDPKNTEDHVITRRFLDLLEKQIHNKPENYLWTHKRWKHRNADIPKGAIIG
ncbi:lipid A biosynthesis acyltransferase [Aquimarina sp. 2201CG5-10]|uniref:lysophospholipid acyltransferase family protein n=1 Tax=Aquimarina callyspongiae TaxID=3098150 RepID=UPI002AB46737|nr:lipid A biosynthesis acyltransferase [Aquimarina sp. 2201CG5-10]MDY8138940.1 lipid A biosynthesis acyltransferase [Aquimarina sp. 2201CG5-10]